MQARELGDWLSYLETLHPNPVDLGLDRVRAVADRLGLLQPASRVVTVAGTNGKGSVCAVLEALCRDRGVRAGLYTSPHLLRYNERIRVIGQPVADRDIIAAFERIEAARHSLEPIISLTYFEFGTLAALDVFARHELDVVILEVGLGGRLDAVNIVDPDIAVITSIALDHEAWLGGDRETIGREKAGILRQGIPVVIADPEPPGSVLERIREMNCDSHPLEALPQAALRAAPLAPENVAAAVTVAGLLGLEREPGRLPGLLRSLQLPGRLQSLEYGGRRVVMDVGHNPAAVARLAEWLQHNSSGPRVALFAALADKNIHDMIQPCRALFDSWYLVDLGGVARALEVTELAARFALAGIARTQQCASVESAWRRIQQEWPAATLVVFGSFFTVAGFMQLMEDERGRA